VLEQTETYVFTSRFEWSVAMRYLFRPAREGLVSVTTVLSVIAIALGVAALISVMSLMNGFRADLIDSLLGFRGHAEVQSQTRQIRDYEGITARISAIPGVTSVRPYVAEQSVVGANGRNAGAFVRGLFSENLVVRKADGMKIVAGDLENFDNENGVVVGMVLARKLGLTVGSQITIFSPKSVPTPFGSRPRYLAYPVRAIVELGIHQFDEIFVGMPLYEAQRFFRTGDTVTNIDIFLDDPENIEAAMPQIVAALGDGPYGIASWRTFNTPLLKALRTDAIGMFLVLSLIVLVAVFNVSTSLVMLVKDKAGDIAILRTMGATRKSIRRIFLIVGLCTGAGGVLVGSFLASLFIFNLESIKGFVEWITGVEAWDPATRIVTELRAEVDWSEVSLTIGLAILLSFLATILPAILASRTDPVSILRHE